MLTVHGLAQIARRSAIVVGIIMLGAFACPPAYSEQAGTVRIGAWNIEWLGNPNSRSGIAEGHAQSPADLATYIEAADISILALAEIGDDNSSDHRITNSTLDSAFSILNRRGANWTYSIFPKDNPTSRNQCIGVAWDQSRAKRVGLPFRVPITATAPNLWDRTPHAVKFSLGAGQTDIVVVPLHMKSNVGGVQATREQRRREAQSLVNTLDALHSHFSDNDVILLGDTNVLRANEPAVTLFEAAGFRDLNSSDMPTTFRGPAPFDRIFVPNAQTEFENAAQEKIALAGLSADDHKVRLSDHYMVVTTLNVLPDDDGPEHVDAATEPSSSAPCGCGTTEPSQSAPVAATEGAPASDVHSVLQQSGSRDLPYGMQRWMSDQSNAAPTIAAASVSGQGHAMTVNALKQEVLRLKLALQRIQLQHASEALGPRSSRRYDEEANVLRDAVWRNRTIQVSWENPTDANRTEREWVQAAIARTWERESGLRFVGWGPADQHTDGIRIRIADEHPRCLGLCTRIKGLPGGMVLNFSFQNWCSQCLQDRRGAIEKIAIHEFGHAIGFAHEQNRTDAPDWCQLEQQGTPGDWYITLYDPDSIMNYCNDQWNNNGQLSQLDIEAVRTLYGNPFLASPLLTR